MRKLLMAALSILATTNFLFAQDKTLTIAEFANLVKTSPNAQVLDARSPEEYALNHIAGAINVDLRDSLATEAVIAKLNPHSASFTYSINNGRSNVLAKKLRSKGFDKVYELPGGLANWVGSGNKLETFGSKGLVISSSQFKQLVNSNDVVLVDFGSKFCGGCRKLIPVLDSVEQAQSQAIKIVRIEMYDNPELVKEQKITSLPTLVLYKNGKIVWDNKGNITYSDLVSAIQNKASIVAK